MLRHGLSLHGVQLRGNMLWLGRARMRRCLMLRCQCGLSLQGLLLSRNMLLLRGARRCCRLVANGLLLGCA